MLIQLKNNRLINSQLHLIFVIIVLIIFSFILLFCSILEMKQLHFQLLNISNIKINQSIKYSLAIENRELLNLNKRFETRIECVGSFYNQSCLFTNLYYFDGIFTILTVKGRNLPNSSVRTEASILWNTIPKTRVFDFYSDLEIFVRTVINPKIIPSVTLYFGQPWHYNIGHALFDGLYAGYVALIRFPPRHLNPFRILTDIDPCNDCWSEDIYSRFGGLGIVKQNILNKLSIDKWFMFDEIIMGSGTFCQRCTQPNLQLPAGIELDASRLFRDRMYRQHGLIPLINRQKSSSESRTSQDILSAYIIDNKRFSNQDRQEINDAIQEIQNYTNSYLKKTIENKTKLKWPLINITFLNYYQIKPQNINTSQINSTIVDSRSPIYELVDNQFIAQLKLIGDIDIHISGPGTAQMYQTFLSDGSIHINLGGIRPEDSQNTKEAYTSYLEQYMTSGIPYIKGLYYPIQQRTKGLKKYQIIKLIRRAAQMILQGFHLPVNPYDNLATDGQLFVEMCQKDKEFCSLVTQRSEGKELECLNLWIEDFIHEQRQWKLGGFYNGERNITCPFNRTLLHILRHKYGI